MVFREQDANRVKGDRRMIQEAILVCLALIVGNYSGAVIVTFWLHKKWKEEKEIEE